MVALSLRNVIDPVSTQLSAPYVICSVNVALWVL